MTFVLPGSFATCDTCDQTMNGSACTEDAYEIRGRDYIRIRYGSETHAYRREHCGDCNTPKGGLHHPGCDVERCPRCLGQSISCDCDDPFDTD